jgi:hypothetical protein
MITRNLPGGKEGGRGVRLTTLSPSVRRLPGKCGSLHFLLPYGASRPVTGITYLTYLNDLRVKKATSPCEAGIKKSLFTALKSKAIPVKGRGYL